MICRAHQPRIRIAACATKRRMKPLNARKFRGCTVSVTNRMTGRLSRSTDAADAPDAVRCGKIPLVRHFSPF